MKKKTTTTQKPKAAKAPAAAKTTAETRKTAAKAPVAPKAAKAAPKAAAAKAPKAPKTLTKRVLFSVNAEPGSDVAVSGDFNNWNPKGKKMTDKKGDGHFSVALNLAPGSYEYKFIINQTWCVDPACMDWVPNSLGTLNSVLHVE